MTADEKFVESVEKNVEDGFYYVALPVVNQHFNQLISIIRKQDKMLQYCFDYFGQDENLTALMNLERLKQGEEILGE